MAYSNKKEAKTNIEKQPEKNEDYAGVGEGGYLQRFKDHEIL